MGDRDVVALEVVVGDDLPVGRLRAAATARTARATGSGSARAAPGRSPTSSASGVASRSRLTKTRPHSSSTRAGSRPSARLVEALAERKGLGHADQLPVEPVRPAVVPAPDRRLALPRPAEQPGAAVTADVAVRAQRVLLVADDEDRLRARAARSGSCPGAAATRRARRAARCARRSAPARPRAAPDPCTARRERGAGPAVGRGGRRWRQLPIALSPILTL